MSRHEIQPGQCCGLVDSDGSWRWFYIAIYVNKRDPRDNVVLMFFGDRDSMFLQRNCYLKQKHDHNILVIDLEEK